MSLAASVAWEKCTPNCCIRIGATLIIRSGLGPAWTPPSAQKLGFYRPFTRHLNGFSHRIVYFSQCFSAQDYKAFTANHLGDIGSFLGGCHKGGVDRGAMFGSARGRERCQNAVAGA